MGVSLRAEVCQAAAVSKTAPVARNVRRPGDGAGVSLSGFWSGSGGTAFEEESSDSAARGSCELALGTKCATFLPKDLPPEAPSLRRPSPPPEPRRNEQLDQLLGPPTRRDCAPPAPPHFGAPCPNPWPFFPAPHPPACSQALQAVAAMLVTAILGLK